MKPNIPSRLLRHRLFTRGRKMAFSADTIHFLHVGKAAGSQTAQVIRQINKALGRDRLVKHHHEICLHDLPENQAYFFSTRDPVTRFKSGFYSRKRKGQPKNFSEWSAEEALAFRRFEHANDLGEALFSEGQRGRDATSAMRSIRHCSRNLVDWFKFYGHLFTTRPPVWILRQEYFEKDLDTLLRRLGVRLAPELAEDSTVSHANDYTDVPPLSDAATRNLQRWYAQDYAFLDLCEGWMKRTMKKETG